MPVYRIILYFYPQRWNFGKLFRFSHNSSVIYGHHKQFRRLLKIIQLTHCQPIALVFHPKNLYRRDSMKVLITSLVITSVLTFDSMTQYHFLIVKSYSEVCTFCYLSKLTLTTWLIDPYWSYEIAPSLIATYFLTLMFMKTSFIAKKNI